MNQSINLLLKLIKVDISYLIIHLIDLNLNLENYLNT